VCDPEDDIWNSALSLYTAFCKKPTFYHSLFGIVWTTLPYQHDGIRKIIRNNQYNTSER
jgi:hypothetical protein